jgi:hypothetical protein
MALSGWGLTPGALEKNVGRSLGGGYGSIGNSPNTVADMMRQKHSAGLKAKQAKEGFDIARTAEANRKGEVTRQFGLDTEKFGFQREDAAKRWADLVRGRELQEETMEGGWIQQELDRALREEALEDEAKWRAADRAQGASQFSQSSSQRDSEFAKSLDLQDRELLSLDAWRKRQMDDQAESEAKGWAYKEKTRQDEINRFIAQQAALLAREQRALAEKKRQETIAKRIPTSTGGGMTPVSSQPSYTWRTSPGGTRYRINTDTGQVFV